MPTLITYAKLVTEGAKSGMPAGQVAKVGALLEDGLKALKAAHEAGKCLR